MKRYFRGLTVARPYHGTLQYRTFADVVVADPADTRPGLYHQAQQIATKKFGLSSGDYVTTWFDLAPDALADDCTPGPPGALFWTLSVWWQDRGRGNHHCVWGESLPGPHDTRSGLFSLARRTAVEHNKVPEEHAVLSFSCGPSLLDDSEQRR